MSVPIKNTDNEMEVTFEDQQKINKFARHNAKLQDLKAELDAKQKDLQNLVDATDELLLLDDEPTIPYQIGEVLVSLSPEDTTNMLERTQDKTQGEIDAIQQQCDKHSQVLSDLKIQLYAKFGTNINLEADDD